MIVWLWEVYLPNGIGDSSLDHEKANRCTESSTSGCASSVIYGFCFSSQFRLYGPGCLRAGGDVSLSSVDVSQLTPQEAVSRLQNHNSALIARVRELQGATTENEAYQKQVADLHSHIKELTADSAHKAEIYRETQGRHKCGTCDICPCILRYCVSCRHVCLDRP